MDHTFKNFVGLIGWTGRGAGRVEWFQISGVFFLVYFASALAATAGAAIWLWKSDRSRARLAGRIAAALVFLFCVFWLFARADGSAPAKRLLYSLLAASPLLALPRLFSGPRTGSVSPGRLAGDLPLSSPPRISSTAGRPTRSTARCARPTDATSSPSCPGSGWPSRFRRSGSCVRARGATRS